MRFGGYLGAPKQQALASRQAPDFFGASKALGSLRFFLTFFAGALEDLFGNFSADCVQHNYKSPLYTPDALARSMVRFAPS